MRITTKIRKRGGHEYAEVADNGAVGVSWYAGGSKEISISFQVYGAEDNRTLASRVVMTQEEAVKLANRLMEAVATESPDL